MVYGKVERHDGVTAIGVAAHHRVSRSHCRRLGVGLPVPCEGLAGHHGGVTIRLVVNSEMEHDDTVVSAGTASRDGEGREGVWRIGVFDSMPRKRLAGDGGGVAVGIMRDGEVQGDNTVAAVLASAFNGVGRIHFGRFRIFDPVPSEGLEGGDGGVAVSRMEDRKLQRDRGVATVDGLEMLYMVTGHIVDRVVPDELLAGRVAPHGGGVVVDDEVHGDHGVAAVLGSEGLPEFAGLRVGDAVPGEAVAAGGVKLAVDGVVDGEVQGDHRIAAVDVRQRLGIVAGLRVGGVVPRVGVAVGGGEFGGGVVVDREVERHGRVATVNGLEQLRIVARMVIDGVVPLIAVASFRRIGGVGTRIEGEVQRDRGVATMNTLEMLDIITRHIIYRIVPNETVARRLAPSGGGIIVEGER